MRIRRACLFVLVALLSAVHVSAQPQGLQALVLRRGVPFTVLANHDGENVVGFSLRDNGSAIASGLKGAVWSAGVVRFRLSSGLSTRGEHVLTVWSYNEGGETSSATAATVTIAR